MLLDRARGQRRLQREPPADEIVRIEATEDQVRIGDGRLVAAEVVARGSRVGASALRSDSEESTRIDVGDRAAASADRADVEPGRNRAYV